MSTDIKLKSTLPGPKYIKFINENNQQFLPDFSNLRLTKVIYINLIIRKLTK